MNVLDTKIEKIVDISVNMGILVSAESVVSELVHKTPETDQILELINEEIQRLREEARELLKDDQ